MNWPDDFTNKIICGDCLEVMKEMPDECVDMAITSPPYWSLRDYGIVQIFDEDSSCKHEWGFSKIEHDNLRYRGHNANVGSNKNPEIHKGKEKSGGLFCQKCGAWRGQLGLEPTPEMYIEHLTETFNEVKRVLKKEGTLWLVIGDTYWSAKGSCFNPGGGKDSIETKRREIYPLNRGNKSDVPNLPQKCLTMVPERLAWSLIQNGWILRNKIVWFKPNSMPSSVKDRFSNRWEHIFLFSKNKKYYFDLDAVREPHKYDGRKDTLYKGGPKDMQIGKHERWPNPAGKNPGDVIDLTKHDRAIGRIGDFSYADPLHTKEYHPSGKNPGDVIKVDRKWNKVPGQESQSIARDHAGWFRKDGSSIVDFEKGKNPGDFWNINTQPFPEAHFAVFPETLCEKPIKAGCPEQVCKKCGKARERIIEREKAPLEVFTKTSKPQDGKVAGCSDYGWHGAGQKLQNWRNEHPNKTIGFTSCDCNADFNSGIVLDPFAGAGTVGVVAKKLGRRFILIDIKKEYCEMAERRIAKVGYQMELRI